MGQNDVKEGSEIRSGLVGVQRGCPGSGIDVDNRKLNLTFGGLNAEAAIKSESSIKSV